MPDKMKVGIIGSSGGSAAQELIIASGSSHEYFIVTDRQCDLETIATRHSLPLKRIETSSNYEFSFKTREFFELNGGVDLIILYFIRLVDCCLFSTYPTFNLHPSLLPKYKGLNSLTRAYNDGIRKVGTTLHMVDQTIDGGPIVAQIYRNTLSELDLNLVKRISFAQKVYLSLYLIDYPDLLKQLQCRQKFLGDKPIINPTLPSSWSQKVYRDFLVREKLANLI